MIKDIKIVIICGVSGSGKNTMISRLLSESTFNFKKIVTYTTRSRSRPNEIKGEDYHFLSETKFKNLIDNNYFLEYEITHNCYYGTPRNSLTKPGNYLMHLDIRGGISIKKIFPDTLIVFIDTPRDQIISRLKKRRESKESIETRLKTADRELTMMASADVVIINNDGQLDIAYLNLKKAIENFLSSE